MEGRYDLTEGFYVTGFGGLYLEGLMHGEAYFRNFRRYADFFASPFLLNWIELHLYLVCFALEVLNVEVVILVYILPRAILRLFILQMFSQKTNIPTYLENIHMFLVLIETKFGDYILT